MGAPIILESSRYERQCDVTTDSGFPVLVSMGSPSRFQQKRQEVAEKRGERAELELDIHSSLEVRIWPPDLSIRDRTLAYRCNMAAITKLHVRV